MSVVMRKRVVLRRRVVVAREMVVVRKRVVVRSGRERNSGVGRSWAIYTGRLGPQVVSTFGWEGQEQDEVLERCLGVFRRKGYRY